MSEGPVGRAVRCPGCNAEVVAIVPKDSRIVPREEDADGKVRVGCDECGETFYAYFRADE